MNLIKKYQDWQKSRKVNTTTDELPPEKKISNKLKSFFLLRFGDITDGLLALNDTSEFKGKIEIEARSEAEVSSGYIINFTFKLNEAKGHYKNYGSSNSMFLQVNFNNDTDKYTFCFPPDEKGGTWNGQGLTKEQVVPTFKKVILEIYQKKLDGKQTAHNTEKESNRKAEEIRLQAEEVKKKFLEKYNKQYFQAQFSNVIDLCTDFGIGEVTSPGTGNTGNELDREQYYARKYRPDPTKVVNINIMDKDILSGNGVRLNKKSIEIMEELLSVAERLEDEGFKTDISSTSSGIAIIIRKLKEGEEIKHSNNSDDDWNDDIPNDEGDDYFDDYEDRW